MDGNEALLREIRAFCKRAGMALTTFGQKAVHEWTLVERLEAGRTIEMRTVDRIRTFIAEKTAELEAAKPPRRKVA